MKKNTKRKKFFCKFERFMYKLFIVIISIIDNNILIEVINIGIFFNTNIFLNISLFLNII